MAKENVSHLVVDSSAFIKNAPIKDIAENVYTVRDVVTEIRDKQTRQNLQVLPYEIHFQEPSPEAIKLVTEFSKKTGDYRSLSAVDIRLISLVYDLEKEFVGTDHIRTAPQWNIPKMNFKHAVNTSDENDATKFSNEQKESKPQVNEHSNEAEDLAAEMEKNNMLNGDEESGNSHSESKHQVNEHSNEAEDLAAEMEKNNMLNGDEESGNSHSESKHQVNEHSNEAEDLAAEMEKNNMLNGDEESGNSHSHPSDGDTLTDEQIENNSEDENDSASDAWGWVTPSNINKMLFTLGKNVSEKTHVMVGCLTTDYAMQNVLIQMRLPVVSVDGKRIKQTRSYILRCYSCFKITSDVTKDFCYNCGNQTLQRISVKANEDGTLNFFFPRRFQINKRGTKYSLPKPQGGKHAKNPVLVEDQPRPHQEMSKKSKIKYDVFDPDYVANMSPFAPTDTTSRSAMLGIRHQKNNFKSRRNPNENHKVYGRRK